MSHVDSTDSAAFQIFDTEDPKDYSIQETRDNSANTSDFDTEIVSEDEEGQIIPANMFFPERVNILKKSQWIRFKKWGDDPCETVFAVRLFGYRINL